MNTKKLTLALMCATLLSANALAEDMKISEVVPPSLKDYDVNGDGTIAEGEQAYKITSYDDLCWLADYVKNSDDDYVNVNAFLANNIVVNANLLSSLDFDENGNVTNASDLDLTEWFPIGYWDNDSYDKYFDGTFDGQGYTISGLYFNNTNQSCVGLFGQIGDDAIVKNVGVIDSYFNGGNDIASVCGYNDGAITNCYNTGSVKGSGNEVGGVCGGNYGTITNCYNTGSVKGSGNEAGGVCGGNYGTIENCYNTGEVSDVLWYIGGVCGYNFGNGTIENCYDFKLNGGTINGYSIVVDNNKITLPADVTLVGKAFEGWYKKDNFEGSAIVSEDAGFGVHTLYAKWVENSTPTAIKAVEAENNKTIKTIKDGQIVIIRNGVMYDMQGRKL